MIEAADYAALDRRFAELLGTSRDLVVIQGEAILPLEAAARGVARPGTRVLNIVTSPYGSLFGNWLRQGGAAVDELEYPPGTAVDIGQAAEALSRGGYSVLSLVHAEAASGVVNPLLEIAAIAKAVGVLVVVDAVASIGAEPLEIDAWDLDLVVVSAQKALAGPTGVSAVVVSEAGWLWLAQNPAAPRTSVLSLLDWKERWVDAGRAELPLIPHHAEMRLLARTLTAAESEGLEGVVARHAAARDLCRRGVARLGLEPFVEDDRAAAAIATTVRPPGAVEVRALIAAARAEGDSALESLLTPAPAAPEAAVRVNHTGRHATTTSVEAALAGLESGVHRLLRRSGAELALDESGAR
jgi:aspartate aminotransferase-like enzyme